MGDPDAVPGPPLAPAPIYEGKSMKKRSLSSKLKMLKLYKKKTIYFLKATSSSTVKYESLKSTEGTPPKQNGPYCQPSVGVTPAD